MRHGERPGHESAPVVPHDDRLAGREMIDDREHVADELHGLVVLDTLRLVAEVVAALVDRHDVVLPGQGRHLRPPRVPEVGESVDHHDQRIILLPQADVMDLHPARIDETLLGAGQEGRGRRRPRAFPGFVRPPRVVPRRRGRSPGTQARQGHRLRRKRYLRLHGEGSRPPGFAATWKANRVRRRLTIQDVPPTMAVSTSRHRQAGIMTAPGPTGPPDRRTRPGMDAEWLHESDRVPVPPAAGVGRGAHVRHPGRLRAAGLRGAGAGRDADGRLCPRAGRRLRRRRLRAVPRAGRGAGDVRSGGAQHAQSRRMCLRRAVAAPGRQRWSRGRAATAGAESSPCYQDVREPVADLPRGDGRRGDPRRPSDGPRDDRPGPAPRGRVEAARLPGDPARPGDGARHRSVGAVGARAHGRDVARPWPGRSTRRSPRSRRCSRRRAGRLFTWASECAATA